MVIHSNSVIELCPEQTKYFTMIKSEKYTNRVYEQKPYTTQIPQWPNAPNWDSLQNS